MLPPEPLVPVPHYYGDIVRQLFVAGAVVLLVGSPFYASAIGVEFPFEIGGGIILLTLAALTNPHGKHVMYLNAIASGVGLLVYETWAIFDYDSLTWLVFLMRELVALVFCGAFYFSMKTLRAMLLSKVGKREEPREFNGRKSTLGLREGACDEEEQDVFDETENILHFEDKERDLIEKKTFSKEEEHHKTD